jgi:hypothetical protein
MEKGFVLEISMRKCGITLRKTMKSRQTHFGWSAQEKTEKP